MDLRKQGHRFVIREESATWTHPLEVLSDDEDCTDMDDAQFDAAIQRLWKRTGRNEFGYPA